MKALSRMYMIILNQDPKKEYSKRSKRQSIMLKKTIDTENTAKWYSTNCK